MTAELPSRSGRAVFISRLDAIRREMAAGDYLTTIYARHRDALGITYSAFRKLVARHAQDAKPVQRRPYGSGKAASQSPATPPVANLPTPRPAATSSPQTSGDSNARREHAFPAPRTFSYDGNPRQDDDALITGTIPRKG